ncbi:hypothetical protein HDU98_010514 [Podochytrium sp. JEL0797]|nr:hypothetical protein HDU98_010514 [Podochytrium sp. JEL0797]
MTFEAALNHISFQIRIAKEASSKALEDIERARHKVITGVENLELAQAEVIALQESFSQKQKQLDAEYSGLAKILEDKIQTQLLEIKVASTEIHIAELDFVIPPPETVTLTTL